MSFTKRRADAPAGFFAVEAAGLRWLAAAEPAGGVPVVRVRCVTTDSITLDELQPGSPSVAAATRFGRQLAHTHDAGAAAFGSPPPGWTGEGFIGTAPLTFNEHQRWGDFYANERVHPYVRTARDRSLLSVSDVAAIEDLCDRLCDGEFDDDAPPARIHGDLWSGNVIWTPSGCVLIDPAAHGGHRETDLAMLALFGCRYLDAVLTGYQEAHPLNDGWQARVPLHQLHPLLVHVVLFGGGYVDQTLAAVAAMRRS